MFFAVFSSRELKEEVCYINFLALCLLDTNPAGEEKNPLVWGPVAPGLLSGLERCLQIPEPVSDVPAKV